MSRRPHWDTQTVGGPHQSSKQVFEGVPLFDMLIGIVAHELRYIGHLPGYGGKPRRLGKSD